MKNKLFWISFILSYFAYAQFYRGYDMPFGRSRVQYAQQFIWSQWRTSQFDVFFYQGGRKLAEYVINTAQKEIKDISSFFDYLPERKFFFVLFNNREDFLASNLGYTYAENINQGGYTRVVDWKIILYFDGNHENLRKQIREGIARIIIQAYLYGEKVSTNVRRAQSLFLPTWFVDGLVAYLKDGWQFEDLYQLKMLLQKNKRISFQHTLRQHNVLVGKAFWNYLIEMHGIETVQATLSMVEVTRNYASALLFVYGKKFKQLKNECFYYYRKQWEDFPSPSFSKQALKTFKAKHTVYQQHFSPDGLKLAYVTDKWDKKKLWLYDVSTRTKRKLFVTGKKWDLSQYFHYPLVAWHPNGKMIAWLNQEKQKRFLYIHNLEDNSTEKFNIEQFTYVNSIRFSPDGLSILLSAVLDGQTDMFLFYPGSNSIKRLTNDEYDEIEAVFSPDGKWIACVTNRPFFDSTQQVFLPATDVVLINPINNQELRVTQSPDVHENNVRWIDKQTLLFLSDTGGFTHVYSARLDSAIMYVDTAVHFRYFFRKRPEVYFPFIVKDFAYHANHYALVIDHGKKKKQYLFSSDDLQSLSMPTVWTNAKKTKKQLHVDKQQPTMQAFLEPATVDSNIVNIYDFQFKTLEKNKNKEEIRQEESPSALSKLKDTLLVSRPQNYNVEYALNNVVTQFTLDKITDSYLPFSANISSMQLSSINGFLKIGGSDVLEDYRIIGGVKLSPNLRENEYILAFENFKRRLDRIWAFHYFNRYYVSEETSIERHQVGNAWIGFAYPFYSLLTWRMFAHVHTDKISFQSYDLPGLLARDKSKYMISLRSELTYDNTMTLTTNILHGWRWKVFSEFYQSLQNAGLNLITFGFDVRLYLKWYKTMITAHRLAWGTSLGSGRLMYLLGGTNQTFGAKFDNKNPFDTTYHYEFITVATNLRGLPVNCRNGNTFFVLNNEWRFPVFQVLLHTPLTWSIFNNLQVVVFNDVGSAFVGFNLFSEKNIIQRQFIIQKPFIIELQEKRFPIVMGNGVGLRTMLWGYFLRFDMGWGWDNFHFTRPSYLFSIGTDF